MNEQQQEDDKKNISLQVKMIIFDCLYTSEEVKALNLPPGEAPKDAVTAQGIMRGFGFHKGRLESHREEVKAILDQMPLNFFSKAQGGGEGWSFLQLCMTRDDEQWGEHPSMEELVCLGIGLNMVQFLLPREMWRGLPGGMPYLMINTLPGGFPKPEEATEAPQVDGPTS